MLIFICLFLLILAGVALGTIPPGQLNLETPLSHQILHLWAGSIRAFGVPMGLILLRFSKNNYVKAACFLWGGYLTVLSALVLIKIDIFAPSANLYGTLLVTAILIICLSIGLFSLLELFALLPNVNPEESKDGPETKSSNEIENPDQIPTNPS